MSLSQDTVDVLKACHPLLKEGRDVVGEAFYKRLFQEHPQVAKLSLIVILGELSSKRENPIARNDSCEAQSEDARQQKLNKINELGLNPLPPHVRTMSAFYRFYR